MKVLFVSSSNNKNGIGPILKVQADSLELIGVDGDHFGIERGGIRGYAKATILLARYLKMNKYDIIHAHYGLSAMVALIAKGKEKLIVSFMGDDIVGSNRLDGSIERTSILVALINVLFSKWFYNHSIVKSDEMLKKMNHSKVSLIPNGVNIDVFCPSDKTLARKKLALDPELKLIIFVSDPAREEKNYLLADKAVNLVNAQKTILLPVFNCDHNMLPDYYNAADCLLLTSFHEGSPNVLKEAMACGCPVVSTDVGDVKWVLGNTEGCLIASFNPIDVSQKLRLAIQFREEHGQTKGRERIIELKLDSESVANKILEVYNKVLMIDE